jgi:hypothetical protein
MLTETDNRNMEDVNSKSTCGHNFIQDKVHIRKVLGFLMPHLGKRIHQK